MTNLLFTKIILRAPNNRLHEVSMRDDFSLISCASAEEVLGQWIIYTDYPYARLTGVHRSKRMEAVSGALVFKLEMTDTGDEFIIVTHNFGLSVLCIQLSPLKCPVELFHNYLNNYNEILNVPESGARSIAGAAASDGRKPTGTERSYRFIMQIVNIHKSAELIKSDLNKHERGLGGASSIDAKKTVSAWKRHPSWYKGPTKSEIPQSINIGNNLVVPLKTVPRSSIGSNFFTGAVTAVLRDLARRLAYGTVGSMSSLVLAKTERRIAAFDEASDMSVKEALNYLKTNKFPNRSQAFAENILTLKADVESDYLHGPTLNGKVPFFLAPPELIFQTFAVSKCLVAIGFPRSELTTGLARARTSAGWAFGDLIAWVDTPKHMLKGWRDRTSKPSNYEPDLIVINKNSQTTLLIDAKFRRDDDGFLPASGIKDIQSYMHEFRLEKAVLLVPTEDDDAGSSSIECDGFEIWGFGIPPSISKADMNDFSAKLRSGWNDSFSQKSEI